MSAPILVAIHRTADADLVVERAARLAVAIGAEFHAVSVVPAMEVGAAVGPSGAEAITRLEARHHDDAIEALRRAAELGQSVGLATVEHLAHGEPAARIVSVADEVGAELIVVGSRGLDAAGRYVLGSVPERILFDPHGHDVFVVRTSGR